ncbi:MAG: helix-turn-helix domain-containing protein [Pseudonocardiales bacterium]|nr:helix-turn-helix domain-containing protein [Pseudonocardiales bacterium]
MRRMCGAVRVLADRDVFDSGTIVTSALGGDMRVSLVSADPHTVVRQASRGGGENDGFVYFCRTLTGRARLTQDGDAVELRPGGIALFDTTRPHTLAMPDAFRMVTLRFPHRVVGLDPHHTRGLTAVPWACATGVGAIVSVVLAELGNHLDELSVTEADQLGNSILTMIRSLLADRLAQTSADPVAARQMLLARMQEFARDHLPDVSLSPAMLARQHNVSLRYVQVLFAEHGTSPARWIRDERLARCYAYLANPQYDHLTVTAIGERWGLCGASQISRLFREQYGSTPREFRKRR